jgi:hypothetical protein
MSRLIKVDRGVAVIGLLLVIGGVVGAATALFAAKNLLHDQGGRVSSLWVIVLVAFTFVMVTGARLWAGIPT